MIEWSRVSELRQEIGADDFDDVVELFLEEVENEIANLRAGCAETALEAKLHFLKGSALNLGFREFSTLCHQGESAAMSGDYAAVDLPATLASYQASRAAFLAGLAQLEAKED